MTRTAREAILGLKYQVQLNRPYAGGFITEHYGQPGLCMHALQVEINRGLYLNERTLERSRRFAKVKRDVCQLVAALTSRVPLIFEQRQAAE